MEKWLELGKKYGYVLVLALVVVGSLFLFFSPEEDWSENEVLGAVESHTIESELDESELAASIIVDIKGEVRKPGIYTLPRGSRLYELIQLAGGITEEGNQLSLNLAQELADQQLVIVPHEDDPIVDFSEVAIQDSQQININTADSSQLQQLPGIGAKKAEAIIAYREENGLFKKVDELKQVSGIGDKTYEALESLIGV
jgi:competence protein ComEA